MTDCADVQPDEDGITPGSRPCPPGCASYGWSESGVYPRCPNCGVYYCWRVGGGMRLEPGQSCPECGSRHADEVGALTEDEWLADLAKKCQCCPGCQALPCGGCQQGAPCDDLCVCRDDERDEPQSRDDLDAEEEMPRPSAAESRSDYAVSPRGAEGRMTRGGR